MNMAAETDSTIPNNNNASLTNSEESDGKDTTGSVRDVQANNNDNHNDNYTCAEDLPTLPIKFEDEDEQKPTPAATTVKELDSKGDQDAISVPVTPAAAPVEPDATSTATTTTAASVKSDPAEGVINETKASDAVNEEKQKPTVIEAAPTAAARELPAATVTGIPVVSAEKPAAPNNSENVTLVERTTVVAAASAQDMEAKKTGEDDTPRSEKKPVDSETKQAAAVAPEASPAAKTATNEATTQATAAAAVQEPTPMQVDETKTQQNQAKEGDPMEVEVDKTIVQEPAVDKMDVEKVPDPDVIMPRDRDCIFGTAGEGHKTNLLLKDLMRLNRVLWKLRAGKDKKPPQHESEVEGLAQHIVDLMQSGKRYQLAGLKGVPRSYMASTGRFLMEDGTANDWKILTNEDKSDNERIQEKWKVLSADEAKAMLRKALLDEFRKEDFTEQHAQNTPYKEFQEYLNKPVNEAELKVDSPDPTDPKDAILVQVDDSYGDKLYEQQIGNKAVFNLASQLVTTYTTSSEKRVEAALAIVRGLDEMEVSLSEMGENDDGEHNSTTPATPVKKSSASSVADSSGQQKPYHEARFMARVPKESGGEGAATWMVLDAAAAAEFALMFVFEVYLEKEIHVPISSSSPSKALKAMVFDTSKPSPVPIDEPTDYDVLFGRGGMTNSHPGNRRFRDIIALHRPDYIRAIKMDKPAVARKIVRAIRFGNPPGRFLKKRDDGKWYDVGDRNAAEKTSQGLRERSNAEKRQRSVLREALKGRKQDGSTDGGGDGGGSSVGSPPPAKKVKIEPEPKSIPAVFSPSAAAAAALVSTTPASSSATPILNFIGTNLSAPITLAVEEPLKSTTVKRKKEDKTPQTDADIMNSTEGLPPNAVDEDGNILVTDYDILCGRGGLTNHHKGNKRFRDIVALHRPDYVRAPKIQKPSVARVIVRAIRNGDPPGRFLRKDEKTGKWVDVGDKKAAEKTSQALREKTNEEREMLRKDPNSVSPGASATAAFLPNSPPYLALSNKDEKSATAGNTQVGSDAVTKAAATTNTNAQTESATKKVAATTVATQPVQGNDSKNQGVGIKVELTANTQEGATATSTSAEASKTRQAEAEILPHDKRPDQTVEKAETVKAEAEKVKTETDKDTAQTITAEAKEPQQSITAIDLKMPENASHVNAAEEITVPSPIAMDLGQGAPPRKQEKPQEASTIQAAPVAAQASPETKPTKLETEADSQKGVHTDVDKQSTETTGSTLQVASDKESKTGDTTGEGMTALASLDLPMAEGVEAQVINEAYV